jgi:SRSO17 transposase
MAMSLGKEKRMKSSQYSTSETTRPDLQEISTWPHQLRELHERLRPHFARPEVHQHALLYLQAVLSEIPRKTSWQIAEHAREANPCGMQRLLSHSVWDEEAVRDALRAFVCQSLSPPPLVPACADAEPLYPVLVLDESGFPKRGSHSAGVAPQYCGRTGRVENCQVGVFLSYVTVLGHALIDRELYLPDDWCADLPRRQAAHIPDHVSFATKPELGIHLLERVQAAGLAIRWVVADTVYGHSPQLREWLHEHDYAFALAVPSIEVG